MKTLIAVVLVALGFTGVASAADDAGKVDARLSAAHAVLHELMATPDKGVPLDIAAKAQCVAVIPAFKKGAFLIGAQYGQGVVTCRTGHGWSAPAFIQLTGASFGLQLGGQDTDLVIVGINHRSFDDLLKDKLKLGGDVAASAGPVGRDSQAGTTDLANAEFLTYSRSRGLFAGVDLTGDVVNQNKNDMKAFYGHDVTYQQVLSGAVPPPPAAAQFETAVSQMFHRGREMAAK
jgi:lipid-binding SYLF domain-containing protein